MLRGRCVIGRVFKSADKLKIMTGNPQTRPDVISGLFL